MIDFSILTDLEKQQYFTQHWGENICGRFKKKQLDTVIINIPHTTFSRSLPVWQKFLVACLIIFGTAIFPFETILAGAPQQNQQTEKTKSKKPIKKKRAAKTKIKYCGFDTNLNKLLKELNDGQIYVSGYTTNIPVKTTPVSLTDSIATTDSNSAVFYPSNIPANKKSNKRKSKPKTNSPAELIIPSALSHRRSKKKK